MADHATKQPACLNCHFRFVPGEPDEYCPRCGQQNHAVNLSIGHVAEEFLEGVFHFDGKVFRTARLLLLKPGELTRRFLVGHRMPYVPPIRLYVFVSFLFFLLLGWTAEHTVEQGGEEFKKGFNFGFKEQSAIPGRTKQLNAFEVPLQHDSVITAREMAHLPDRAPVSQVDSLIRRKGSRPNFANRLLVRRYLRWRHTSPEEVMHGALRGASILLFFLMPLAALLLKGAYRHQQRYYLGHLIFTVHLHCVLFVLLIFSTLLDLVHWNWLSNLLPLLILPYLVLALRRVYAQGWGKTVAKGMLLATSYALVLLFAIVVAFVVAITLG